MDSSEPLLKVREVNTITRKAVDPAPYIQKGVSNSRKLAGRPILKSGTKLIVILIYHFIGNTNRDTYG